ncbi:MAG: hypothetical protein RMK29_03060 [Myxococcales bacterium]|nr:hypothetical protein [Myxococcota bacterium]MDW8280663.1 hypothetical protein [Myxococcales bacterium]
MAVAIYAAPPEEMLPTPLAQALGAVGVQVLPGGALAAAGQALAAGRRAFAEMRCSDALGPLTQAEERLLAEVPVEDGRALLADVLALILSCADRLGDGALATRAADRLLMTGAQLPPDVMLTLRRYRAGIPYGPPPPPTRVETDPPGAQVIRNLLRIGAAPIDVPGGHPEVDLLDVELDGHRKVHRPLGSGERLALGLRPEDRPGVLVDKVAARPLGSDAQAVALAALAPLWRAGSLPASKVLVFAPLERSGTPAAGERLRARVFDVSSRRWIGPVVEIEAGSPTAQAQQLLALTAGSKAPQGGTATAPPSRERQQPKPSLRLPFVRAKWYSWVIAGGVVALIAGLLIAERFGTDKVTIEATR